MTVYLRKHKTKNYAKKHFLLSSLQASVLWLEKKTEPVSALPRLFEKRLQSRDKSFNPSLHQLVQQSIQKLRRIMFILGHVYLKNPLKRIFKLVSQAQALRQLIWLRGFLRLTAK